MRLRRPTEWNRCTAQKAKAECIVAAEENALSGSLRRVSIVMREGSVAFAIRPKGHDAPREIASSRTFEWAEMQGPWSHPPFFINEDQELWAIVTGNGMTGVVNVSVIIEYIEGSSL